MREIGISPRFSRDKFVPLQMKQRYSTRDISGKVFLTLFFRVFVPFLSLADFVSRDKNLQVADLQWLKLYLGGLITTTTSNHQIGRLSVLIYDVFGEEQTAYHFHDVDKGCLVGKKERGKGLFIGVLPQLFRVLDAPFDKAHFGV